MPTPTARYVSPTGDDSAFDGLSWDTPKQTILAAYDTLPIDGGTIYVADGSYVGGEVANQGIWLMSAADAQYTVLSNVTFTNGSNSVTGSGTSFTTRVSVGDLIRPNGAISFSVVQAITSDTQLVILDAFRGATVTGGALRVPPGWRAEKGRVRFIGLGNGFQSLPIQFARPGAAVVTGGRPTDSPPGWVRDSMKPCIWLAGTAEPIWFENLNFFYPQIGVRLGIASDNSNRNTLTALVDFQNVNFFAPPDGSSDLGAGPLVDSGFAFWVTWRRCSLLAYASAPQGNDRRCAMLLKNDPGGSPSGLWVIDDCRFAGGGGIKYSLAGVVTSWGNMYVTDTVMESDGVVPTDPLFWIPILPPGNDGSACFLANLVISDGGAGSSPCVKIATGIPASIVTAINAQDVEGPATLMGSSRPVAGTTMGANRQVGLTGVGARGPTQSRAFGGPTTTRFAPKALTNYPPGPIGTVSVASTDGPTGLPAYRLTTSVAPGTRDSLPLGFLGEFAPATVGDIWIMGAWLRAPSGFYLDAPAVALGCNDGIFFDLNGISYVVLAGDSSWQWQTVVAKVAAVNASPADMFITAWMYPGLPVDIFQPVVYLLPAGSCDPNDAMEWAQYLAPIPAGSTPGNAIVLPGQNMEFAGAAGSFGGYQMGYALAAPSSGTWAAGSIVFNGSPGIGSPKGWVCTTGGSPGTWVSMGNL